jgi:hypothetical protein
MPSTDKAKRAEQKRSQRAKRTADAAQRAHARAIDGPQPETTRPAIKGYDPEAEWGGLVGDGSTNWYDEGYDREPVREIAALDAGFPPYWHDVCPYQGDERRWVLYCLRQKWTLPVFDPSREPQLYQRAAEDRGRVIHDRLQSAPVDVLRLARWLRDGHAAYALDMDPARIAAALIRLRDMGIYKADRIQ